MIDSAHIVASTLSFSGSHIMRNLEKAFDVVIIDEAAQAVEPSILIPLSRGAKQVCFARLETLVYQHSTVD